MKTQVAIALVLALLFSSSAVAGVNTGNKMLKFCGALFNEEFSSDHVACLWYVDGFRRGSFYAKQETLLASGNPDLPDLFVCIPLEVTNGQLARVLYQWLKSHPSELHEGAGQLTWRAFYDAWPCKKMK